MNCLTTHCGTGYRAGSLNCLTTHCSTRYRAGSTTKGTSSRNDELKTKLTLKRSDLIRDAEDDYIRYRLAWVQTGKITDK